MNSSLAKLLSCFIFPRGKRRAFRARYCVTKETQLGRLERKIDLLMRAFLLKEAAPEAFRALSVPAKLQPEISVPLSGSLYANLGENGEIKRTSVALQAELFRELFYLLPSEKVTEEIQRLLSCNDDGTLRLLLLDNLSWIYRRDENYAAAVSAIESRFDFEVLPPALLRRLALCALRSGNGNLANRAMRQYHARFGTRDLWKNAELAQLSATLGNSDSTIREVVALSLRIDKGLVGGVFEKLLRGKRVAVVGNGPSEVGRKNGSRIDDYDIVIRFNDFPETLEFREDYGAKTDVWVSSCWTKTNWKKHVPVILAGDFFYSDEFPNTWLIENLSRDSGVQVLAIPLALYQKIRRESGIKLPTLGVLVLAWIKEINPVFSVDDVFGFSFKEPVAPKKLEHYYASSAMEHGTIHNLDEERIFLRALFKMEASL